MNEVEKAWLAAFIDSEGNIRIDRPRGKYDREYCYPRITMVNTCWAMLERANEITGTGKWYETPREKEHHKPCWRFIVNGTTAVRVLEQIRPYLIAKTEIADEVLSLKPNL